MTPIEIRIIDLDFPVGSKNKTATLITGETRGAAGRRRLHPRRRPPPGRRGPGLRQDADQGLHQPRRPRLLLGRRGDRRRLPRRGARRHAAGHRAHPRRLRGQAQGLGAGRRQPAHPPGRPRSADRRHRLRRPPLRAQGRPRRRCPTATTSGRPSTGPSSAASCSSSNEHVWIADTATPEQRAAWIALLDEMEALDAATRRARPPPARRPADVERHRATPATTSTPSRRSSPRRADGAAADRGPGRALPRRRHADRRPDRRQGRQGRNELGLT